MASVLVLGLLPFFTQPRPQQVQPPALQGVDVIERLGERIPLELTFTDPQGRAIEMRDLFGDGKPIVLALVYYRCPMLCNLVLGGLVRNLRELDWKLGRQYRVVTVSIDPRDDSKTAADKQHGYLQALGQPHAASDWPFLVGREQDVAALAGALGFRYKYDQKRGEYAHPAVVFVLTPTGVVSRYLYGIDFPPRHLKIALLQASEGRTGSAFERVLMHCYQYDPASRKYKLYVARFLQIGGGIILLAVGTLLARLWHRELQGRRAMAQRSASP